MKVTYLNHSGFLLEWEHSYWLFDYYKGSIPDLDPEKDILVFCSHSHPDHFNPEIFSLLTRYPYTTFIFSNEIFHTHKNLQANIHFLNSRTNKTITTHSGDTLQIYTLHSTDCGCAFFIKYNGRNIYHAGDLHWWYWEGEDPDWNKKMTTDYKEELKYLNERDIDLAFTPLDPRQEKDYALGMNYFLNHTHTKHMFPMHFWDDFSITERYATEHPVPDTTSYHIICQNGQTFEIMI